MYLFYCPFLCRGDDGVGPGQKKDSEKIPRYIGTRVNELFPVRKNSIRLKLLSEKEIAKVGTPPWISYFKMIYHVFVEKYCDHKLTAAFKPFRYLQFISLPVLNYFVFHLCSVHHL